MGHAALPAVRELFKEKNGSFQEIAAFALNGIGEAAVPTLVEALQADNVDSRRLAARTLIMTRPAAKSAVPALISALTDPDRYVRDFAAAAMCAIGPDAQAAVPALRECLKDAQRHMQIAAATVLGEIGPAARDAIPDLINALSDIGAASDASRALAKIGPAAIPALTDVQKNGNERARSLAAEALKTIDANARPKTDEAPIPSVLPRRP